MRITRRLPTARPRPDPDIATYREVVDRRAFLIGAVALGLAGCRRNPIADEPSAADDKWRKVLTKEQYAILREGGTERPFTSKLLDEHRKPAKQPPPVARRNGRPTRKRSPSATHSRVGLLNPSRVEGRDRLLGRRVHDGNRHARDSTMRGA